jgi:hypothetical protein
MKIYFSNILDPNKWDTGKYITFPFNIEKVLAFILRLWWKIKKGPCF